MLHVFTIKIDNNTCHDCGECEVACPFGGIAWDGEKLYVDELHCIECLRCVEACPYGAIEVGNRLTRI